MIAGNHIAITGALSFSTRENAFRDITAYGGIPQSFVTRETDYLVVGRFRNGSVKDGKSIKLRTAERYRSLGVPISIISGDELMEMISGQFYFW